MNATRSLVPSQCREQPLPGLLTRVEGCRVDSLSLGSPCSEDTVVPESAKPEATAQFHCFFSLLSFVVGDASVREGCEAVDEAEILVRLGILSDRKMPVWVCRYTPPLLWG